MLFQLPISRCLKGSAASVVLTVVVAFAQDSRPVLIKQVEPVWSASPGLYIDDMLPVEIVVDEKGKPFSLRSPAVVPDAVVEALRQWEFRPGQNQGRPGAFAVRVAIAARRQLDDILALTMVRRGRAGGYFDEYADAKSLSIQKAKKREDGIAKENNPVQSRTQLLAWAASQSSPDARQLRTRQILALARDYPDAAVLADGLAMIDPSDSANYSKGRDLWLTALAAHPEHFFILQNATNYLRLADPEASEKALAPAVPKNGLAAVWLGEVWALAALGVTAIDASNSATAALSSVPESPFAIHARAALIQSSDVRVSLAGLSVLRNAGSSLFRLGIVPTGATDLCNQLLAAIQQKYPPLGVSCDFIPTHAVGADVQPPKLTNHVDPEYPEEARAAGSTGTVYFEGIVGADGTLRSLGMLSGPLVFHDAARKAVLKWRFRPALVNGVPAPMRAQIEVNFRSK